MLLQSNNTPVFEDVIGLLDDADLCVSAISFLGRLKDERAIVHLRRIAEKGSLDLPAAEALRLIGTSKAAEAVVQICLPRSVQEKPYEGMILRFGELTIPYLIEHLDGENSRSVALCLAALGYTPASADAAVKYALVGGPPSVLMPFIGYAEELLWKARSNSISGALKCLNEIGTTRSLEMLLRAFSSNNQAERLAAASLLVDHLDDPRFVNALCAGITDSSDTIRKGVIGSLYKHTFDPSRDSSLIESLSKQWTRETDSWVKAEILKILTYVKEKRIAAHVRNDLAGLLKEGLNYSNHDNLVKLIRSLGTICDPEAIPLLLRIIYTVSAQPERSPRMPTFGVLGEALCSMHQILGVHGSTISPADLKSIAGLPELVDWVEELRDDIDLGMHHVIVSRPLDLSGIRDLVSSFSPD